MSWGFFMTRRQILTVVTAVCYPDEGTFDYWASQSEDGSTFDLLGAKICDSPTIANQLQRVLDLILEP